MKLSIITINYNDAEGLQKTIQSVVKQTYKEFEYIVIDGGSTDKSIDIIKSYADKIHYWVSEKDSGVYNAQNKGILKANGEYVIFLNSGDYFKNDNVIKLLFEKSQGQDIIYGDILYELPNEELTQIYPDELDFGFFIHNTLPHPCSLIKKELLINYGLYKEELRICADWAFFIDVICKGNASYKHVNLITSVFLIGGLSSDVSSSVLEKDLYLNTYYKLFMNEN
jgi:glycosyltransferase involved in cell wall biosynthesis